MERKERRTTEERSDSGGGNTSIVCLAALVVVAAGFIGARYEANQSAKCQDPEMSVLDKEYCGISSFKDRFAPDQPTIQASATGIDPNQEAQAASVAASSAIHGGFVHENINSAVFWAGEGTESSGDSIGNSASAYIEDWVGAFGGVDSPEQRCDTQGLYFPWCDRKPNLNPYYVALPMSDRDIFKDWVELCKGPLCAYAQVMDVGPCVAHDEPYVLHEARPQVEIEGSCQNTALDSSPALVAYMNDYNNNPDLRLRYTGIENVSWRFVDTPLEGPWTLVVS